MHNLSGKEFLKRFMKGVIVFLLCWWLLGVLCEYFFVEILDTLPGEAPDPRGDIILIGAMLLSMVVGSLAAYVDIEMI